MRPLRLLLSIALCVLGVFTFTWLIPTGHSSGHHHDPRRRSAYRTLLDWHAPSSLFPPSAVISLTGDNSTFFLARPADFGPPLPAKSLSAPLWVGNGFGDDHLGTGPAIQGEGELGCSDVPDWNENASVFADSNYDGKERGSQDSTQVLQSRIRRDAMSMGKEGNEQERDRLEVDDGTDNHLHPSTDNRVVMKTSASGSNKRPLHADIQSLQEAAEIQGRIVLLSRGGCGFLDKVKWAQRRGAVAVIVGDDARGIGLVTMYARGDTSNVTIPSIFTSHTTAHLLASLMPSGSTWGKGLAVTPNSLDAGLKSSSHHLGNEKQEQHDDRPNFTTTSSMTSPTAITSSNRNANGHASKQMKNHETDDVHHAHGFLRRLFSVFSSRHHGDNTSRPPSSGSVEWSMRGGSFKRSRRSEEEESSVVRSSRSHTSAASGKKAKATAKDDFVIGVQDWRDPDLLDRHKESSTDSAKAPTATSSIVSHSSGPKGMPHLRGGSITPSSGEYSYSEESTMRKPEAGFDDLRDHPANHGWINGLFGLVSSGDERSHSASNTKGRDGHRGPKNISPSAKDVNANTAFGLQDGELWVTLTPTPMSTSPFFDTLLVLVVSPLVTLTIVYALLILRSRIRRRRWRAPKSVVERLPVRTYQTMPSSTSTRHTSPAAPHRADVNTPLLPTISRPILNARVQSFQTSDTNERAQSHQDSSTTLSDEILSPTLDPVEEKCAAGLAEWRRKYGWKQKECVVCLEEYVDGVSRVMSLPCGHEFHAECITPWLTNRRRTCPICKGDVVRSLARASTSATGSLLSPRLLRYSDTPAEDEAAQQPESPASPLSTYPQDNNSSSSPLESGASNDHVRR